MSEVVLSPDLPVLPVYRHTCYCPACQPQHFPALPPQGPAHLCWQRGQQRGWTQPEYRRWLILWNMQRLFRCSEVNPYAGYVIFQMHGGKRGRLPETEWEAHMCMSCGNDLCKEILYGFIKVVDMKAMRYG